MRNLLVIDHGETELKFYSWTKRVTACLGHSVTQTIPLRHTTFSCVHHWEGQMILQSHILLSHRCRCGAMPYESHPATSICPRRNEQSALSVGTELSIDKSIWYGSVSFCFKPHSHFVSPCPHEIVQQAETCAQCGTL